MATLTVNVTDNFSADALSGIDVIEFTNLAGTATATFAASQFDNVAILGTVLWRGSTAANGISVTGNSIDASLWQFDQWGDTDFITLIGKTSADTIAGSSQNDIIFGLRGKDRLSGGSGADTLAGGDGRDIITGGADIDTLFGGDGNDQFVYSAAADDGNGGFTESIDGGNGGADKIVLDSGLDDVNLLFASITNVEELVFKSAGLVTFSGLHVQQGGIARVTGSSGSDQLKLLGSDIDLSGVAFDHWTGADGAGTVMGNVRHGCLRA